MGRSSTLCNDKSQGEQEVKMEKGKMRKCLILYFILFFHFLSWYGGFFYGGFPMLNLALILPSWLGLRMFTCKKSWFGCSYCIGYANEFRNFGHH